MFLSHLREDRITRGKAQCLLAVGVPLDMRQLAYPSRGYYSRYSLRLACNKRTVLMVTHDKDELSAMGAVQTINL